MAAEENLLPTPAGYATPQQLAEVRAYFQNMRQGSGQQPVKHWTQGISNMVNALVGGYGFQKTVERENEARRYDQVPENMPGWSGETIKTSADAAGMPPAKGESASVRTNNPGAQWPGPTASMFGSTGVIPASGGNKLAVFDDPVKGAAAQFALLEKGYTGMPLSAAVAKWSGGNNAAGYAAHIAKNTGLSPNTVLTPELLRTEKGIALAKAMADWEAGGKYPMSDQQWQAAHKMALSGGQRGPAMAFNGQPVNVPPVASDAPPSMASALARPGVAIQPPVRPPPPQTRVAADPDNIPPGLVPQRTPVTRRQFENTMQSPYVSQEMKQFVAQSYYSQGQPVEMATTGGRRVINPRDPSEQMYIPDLKSGNIKGVGGSEVPVNWTIGPKGTIKYLTEEGAPSATGGVPRSNPNIDTPDLQYAPKEEGKIPPGMLGALPPEILTGQSAPKAAPVGSGAPPSVLNMSPSDGGGGDVAVPATGTKVAQIPSTADRMLDALADKSVVYEGRKANETKDVESYTKRFDTAVGVGRKSAISKPAIAQARTLIEDPEMIQGFGSGLRTDFKRFLSLVSENPKVKRSVEVSQAFDKLISGSILDDLKVVLEGLGQVRVAEIDLLKGAAANRTNDLGANRAILNQMLKAHDMASAIGQISTGYAQGVRWDKNGKVIRDQNGAPMIHTDRPTNAGLESAISQYAEKHPILTPKERTDYEEQFAKKPGYEGKLVPVPQKKRPKLIPQAAPPGLPPGATLDQ